MPKDIIPPLTLDSFFQNKEPVKINSEKESLDEFFKETLIKNIIERFHFLLKHHKSKNLQLNPFLDNSNYELYTDNLDEYDEGFGPVEIYNRSNPQDKKINFVEEGNPNIGWKVHINIHPKDVVEVSNYLKLNGFRHKFLHGGEVDAGKIFTIYIGDYHLTKSLALKLSTELKKFLCKPASKNEIELASGVVGRFVGTKHIKNEFHQYGNCGFSWLKKYQSALSMLFMSKPDDYEDKKNKLYSKAEYQSFSALLSLYGKYFYDTENRL